jgi:MoaA/NifB/PqqE/SkfB family radical SAM enzyme
VSDKFIKLSSGDVLPVLRQDYDAVRSRETIQRMQSTGVRPFCHAPFVNLDFSPTGSVTPCNHWHSAGIEGREHDFSILDAWRGKTLAGVRRSMLDYTLDRGACRHCVRQVELGQFDEVFARCQFDQHPTDSANPSYPKRIIFRLSNTCNLACIMCDGDTSSRIRAEFDRLPPLRPAYGKRFFDDIKEMLPHLEHVEFYGGEPFLVKEHLQILGLIAETRARCSIYVNTNGTVLTEKVKNYLETLNVTTIAISMDAVNPDLHFRIRKGLKGEIFARNFEWYVNLAERRRILLMLNVTEHRKNWFEIPEIFKVAQRHNLYVHINTCIHPANVTLYTLPSIQLAYVLDFAERYRKRLISECGETFRNLHSYDYFLSLMRRELSQRRADWVAPPQGPTALCDAMLDPPIPGSGVCADPADFLAEVSHASVLDYETNARFRGYWETEVRKLRDRQAWSQVPTALASTPIRNTDRRDLPPAERNGVKPTRYENRHLIPAGAPPGGDPAARALDATTPDGLFRRLLNKPVWKVLGRIGRFQWP